MPEEPRGIKDEARVLSRDISYQNTKYVNKTDWVTTKGGVGCWVGVGGGGGWA